MNAHANHPVIESANHSSRLDAGPSFLPGQNRPLGKIAHLTSVHARHDVRIFIKQCRTLSAHGYEVTLVVADGKGDERRDGVTIVDVGMLPGRLNRMFGTVRRVLERAIALDADIYHLHDPELIPTGLELKRLGKTVIFDAHEDTPRQLLGKPYLNRLSRHALSLTFSRFERYACSRFDAIVAATPFIRDKFLHIHPVTVDVNNFPMTGELDAEQPWAARQQEVSYVGGISATRGIRQLVQAAALLRSPTRINLAGRFSEPDVEAEVRGHAGWARINDLGFLDRAGVRDVLARSLAGVVTLLPLPNYLDSHPTKMFEYMSAGIPVIASDFPLLRTIVEGSRCGLCVDPLDPGAIAAAIDYLAEHLDLAQSLGENGRKAVSEKYNWNGEAAKLTDLYGDLAYAK
jgi:glycosyltransferase involved in cell wall biosynthesis